MKVLGRRAAIGATTVALVLAAAGTSLAAVRASGARGVTPSGVALPAPSVAHGGLRPTRGPTLDGLVPDVTLPPVSGPGDLAAPAGAQPAPGPVAAAGATTAASPPATLGRATTPALVATSARTAIPTLSTLPPASGPTPTTSPSRPVTACPTSIARGALPPRGGPLQAVNFSLRWPIFGPVVLVPQASAVRSSGAVVKILNANAPMGADGTSLTLVNPLAVVSYTLESGSEKDRGSIRFTSISGPDVTLTQQACRNTTSMLYDVNRGVLQGSPLRIVGLVAPAGTVTITPDGGTAHFRSAAGGTYDVTLLTANDAGAAGQVITVTVTVA